MENILNYDEAELKQWMDENGEKPFRAKQFYDWIYKGVFDFDDMKNLSQKTMEKLKKNFYIGIPSVVRKLNSKKGDTVKFLFSYNDGNIIECVVMKYDYGNSICISTQVGCRMGCSFCASTIGGRVRDLTSGEILAQILKAQDEIGERISNIVLMGSGEPLDNYHNVIKFIRVVNSEKGLNIGQRHITLSTCGIVPKIYDLMREDLQITLAISLHASDDETRKKIMPVANKYSISEILEACRKYSDVTGRRITFEYSLVKGVNDDKESAKKLGELLSGMLCHVNLIPVNTVNETSYEKPESFKVKKFCDTLLKYKIESTIRKEMGADINAACGQLRRNYIEESEGK
ncbi:23S rRNA (adenine(2503)-C(2))-methyltransferase RlmN [Clostridium felsineum]|uniref:Probable dual-specificity RNA methyltransferase RlmN n=1 Tax=Clostridium felsineum TaxID=36839 RepID=A0A1S8M9A9_9CLOT|nr:23S rRNA (adenine(2503)-C(2))-methyltransferase RlmN [Clostridium felsineum]MCR3759307.1 23S rRNA (adenine(2503)-C(2))-methyltransferase RlmN [Clostridium felsineum]URZ06551.1 putative dual-specificity RNA methyltransferase RlmN [Clostridium felsineum]URZ11586.1 putative dual-specificity RNA methyltransferase RlmN [Clostridium felsineum]URZ16149.1 putative dual-specificity RNA methyltransferase RlmN [Clostridium felsineum DSM 794]